MNKLSYWLRWSNTAGMLISACDGTVGLHQNIYYSGNTLMLHSNVLRRALLSLELGPIHGSLKVKSNVDQMIKCAVYYWMYQQHVFCMCVWFET